LIINNLYKKNLELLAKKNKYMADKIDELKISNKDFEILKSKKTTLKININKSEKLVHSKYRPSIQAKRKIDTIDFKNHNLFGIAGIGCGYYIEEIIKNINNGSRLIIFENRLDILKEVMKNKDLTSILRSPQLFIIDGTGTNYINYLKNILRRIDFISLTMGNIDFFKTPVLKEKEKKEYKEFQINFFSTITYISKMFGNSSEDTLVGLKNNLKNVEYAIKSKDFTKIKKFKNKPAILVAAGPSLDKNIKVLKKIQDNALIIACDTIIEKLLKNNITPDIVTALERSERSYDYFFKDLYENELISEEVTLMALGVVDPRIFNNFPGDKISLFRKSVPTERWFPDNIKDVNAIEVGSSVANLNLSIANILGASPIVLVGQDLAYSKDGKSHTMETGYEKNNDNRDLDTKNKNDLVEVEGYNGEKLISRKWWKIFKQWFELKIVKDNIYCIDATEGGAYIKGTEVRRLEDVAKEFFNEEKTSFNNELKKIQTNDFKTKIRKFILSLNNLHEDLISRKEEIILIIKKLDELISNAKFEEDLDCLMKNFNVVNNKIRRLFFGNSFLYFILQPIYLNMKRFEVKIDNMEVSKAEICKQLYSNQYNKIIESKEVMNKTIGILNDQLEVLNQKYYKKDELNENEL